MLLFVPLALVTAVLIIGVFAMPAMVEHVAGQGYAQLARREGGCFAGSLWSSVAAPVYGGLAFIHYYLARLAQLRDEPVAAQ